MRHSLMLKQAKYLAPKTHVPIAEFSEVDIAHEHLPKSAWRSPGMIVRNVILPKLATGRLADSGPSLQRKSSLASASHHIESMCHKSPPATSSAASSLHLHRLASPCSQRPDAHPPTIPCSKFDLLCQMIPTQLCSFSRHLFGPGLVGAAAMQPYQ